MTLDRVPTSIWRVTVRGQADSTRIFTARTEARDYRSSLVTGGVNRNFVTTMRFPVDSGIEYTK